MARRVEPYWYPIVLVGVIAAALFVAHLATGFMPPRAALDIFGFPIYWYGIWIVTGVALGAWVVARLAAERARRVFEHAVPADIRALPLDQSGLFDEIAGRLASRRRATLGQVLWEAGLDSRLLGLKKPQADEALEALAGLPGVERAWVIAAPWRPWNPDHVWNGLLIILILALFGARLYHILTPSPSMATLGIESPLDYLRDPIQIVNIRAGGLGIYGGLAGGLLGLILYTRRNRLPTLGWADLSTVGVALGQAIGRWGNFFNQELYGRPTDLPWAIHIDPLYRLPAYADFDTFHPTFLYESLWSLLTFFILLRLARRYSDRLRPGEMLALYLIAYAAGRSLIELVRLDSRAVTVLGLESSLAVATLVSLAIAVVAALLVIGRRLARRSRGVSDG